MTRHVNFAIIPALPLVSFCKWKFIRKEQLPSAPSPSSSLTLPSCQQTTEASDLWFFGPKIWRIVLHLRKLTWNPKIGGWKMSFLLERHILRPYVSFRVCVFRFQPNFLVQNFGPRVVSRSWVFRNASGSSCPATSVSVKGPEMSKRPEATN